MPLFRLIIFLLPPACRPARLPRAALLRRVVGKGVEENPFKLFRLVFYVRFRPAAAERLVERHYVVYEIPAALHAALLR